MKPKNELERWAEAQLQQLALRGERTSPITLEPVDAVHAVLRPGGQRLTLFSTNDYLGLSTHPAVREAVAQAALRQGMGPRGSPLICGRTSSHEALEAELAALMKKPAALLFSTGYAANIATVSGLADPNTHIFSDALNHASIIDGCRLAARTHAARVSVYRHNDADHLEALLKESDAPRKMIVSETVFSMDGDLAPLAALTTLRARFDAPLILDESHALLIYGDGGGLADAMGLTESVDAQIGTLSKAVGALGGFCATSAPLAQWLINRGRAHVFSTAAPAPIVEGVRCALRLATPALAARVLAHAERLRASLASTAAEPLAELAKRAKRAELTERADLTAPNDSTDLTYPIEQPRQLGPTGPINPTEPIDPNELNELNEPTGPPLPPIVPIVLGDPARVMNAQRHLLEHGLHVAAVRPPTVPAGTSRLRITLSAAHSETEVAHLIETLKSLYGRS